MGNVLFGITEYSKDVESTYWIYLVIFWPNLKIIITSYKKYDKI